MKLGICPRCKKVKLLTRHSKIGGHVPPFKYICRKCHDNQHNIKPNTTRRQMQKRRKYQPGTKRMHKKAWKKKR